MDSIKVTQLPGSKQLPDGMSHDYMKVLVHDTVLPDVGSSEVEARFDLTIIAIDSSLEMIGRQFIHVLESAGPNIGSTWSWPDQDRVIEAEVAVSSRVICV